MTAPVPPTAHDPHCDTVLIGVVAGCDCGADMYPVGVLSDWQQFLRRRQHEGTRKALRRLRYDLRFITRWARQGNWRAVRNSFNGYLAEHPTAGTRCGHGWTKTRALRDLERHLAGGR